MEWNFPVLLLLYIPTLDERIRASPSKADVSFFCSLHRYIDLPTLISSAECVDVSGDEGIRTPDPLLARQVLSQLSYTPMFWVFYLICTVFSVLSGLKWTRTTDLTLIRRAL